MLIENPDAFKTWLTSILEPLCEADPAALAKYVYALVKKDKPLDDLRDGMVDQLDVFLQQETKPFVELLFKTLETQEYLIPGASVLLVPGASQLSPEQGPEEPPSPPGDDRTEPRPPSRDLKAEKDVAEKNPASRPHPDKRDPAAATKHRIVLNRTTKFVPATVPKEKPAYATEQTLVKVMPDLLEDSMNEPLPARNSRRDKKSDSDKEDRRRRVYRSRSRSWERSRRGAPALPRSGQWRNRSPPLQQPRYRRSRSGSPPPLRAPRYRNISPPPGVQDTELPKNRSRSRSRERLMSPLPATALRDRLDRVSRERDRERQTRTDRPVRDRIDRERDRVDRERDRVDRDRDRERDRPMERERDRRILRDPPGGADTPTQDSNPGDCTGQSRGTTTTLAGIFAPVPKKRCRDFDEKGYCMRGDLCQFDHGLDPVVLEDAALSRVLALPITGIPPPRPVPGCLTEYNPLAPDIWARGGRFSAPPPPPPPPPPQPHHLQRELIPIPTVSRVEEMRPNNMNPMIPGVPVKGGGAPAPMMSVRPPMVPQSAQFPAQNQHTGPPPNNNYARRGNNQNRHHSPKIPGVNCSLELKKVPRGLNDILHLNNHFSKFGKIVNIQVSYEGDPEAAIVTFSSHTEANVAYKSTEAVLNNRFIKVFWHNTESKQENVPPGQRISTKDKMVTPNQHLNNNNHVSHNKVLINKDNLKITNTALAEAKHQKLQKQQDEAASAAALAVANGELPAADKALTSNGEAIQKPENNGLAPPIQKMETPATIEMAALVKKRGEGAVKIVRDLRRRTQMLLDKQLQQQKILVGRLEGNPPAGQRELLLATIKTMQESIDKTRKELVSLSKTGQQQDELGVVNSLNNMSIGTKRKYMTNNLVGVIVKRPRSKEEAQKEILDAELDLFTKQQEGQDVTELMRKVADLRRQQSVLRHSLASRRGTPQRAAMRAKFSKMAAMANKGGMFVNQSVDHRPRSLMISGYEGDEQALVEQHFAQYGEIVRRVVDPNTPSLWIQFDSRKAAELASSKGKQFNDRTLSVNWMDPLKRAAPLPAVLPATPAEEAEQGPVTAQTPGETKPDMVTQQSVDENSSTMDDAEFEASTGNITMFQGGVELSEDILLQDDEEEDEEDRSWRR